MYPSAFPRSLPAVGTTPLRRNASPYDVVDPALLVAPSSSSADNEDARYVRGMGSSSDRRMRPTASGSIPGPGAWTPNEISNVGLPRASNGGHRDEAAPPSPAALGSSFFSPQPVGFEDDRSDIGPRRRMEQLPMAEGDNAQDRRIRIQGIYEQQRQQYRSQRQPPTALSKRDLPSAYHQPMTHEHPGIMPMTSAGLAVAGVRRGSGSMRIPQQAPRSAAAPRGGNEYDLPRRIHRELQPPPLSSSSGSALASFALHPNGQTRMRTSTIARSTSSASPSSSTLVRPTSSMVMPPSGRYASDSGSAGVSPMAMPPASTSNSFLPSSYSKRPSAMPTEPVGLHSYRDLDPAPLNSTPAFRHEAKNQQLPRPMWSSSRDTVNGGSNGINGHTPPPPQQTGAFPTNRNGHKNDEEDDQQHEVIADQDNVDGEANDDDMNEEDDEDEDDYGTRRSQQRSHPPSKRSSSKAGRSSSNRKRPMSGLQQDEKALAPAEPKRRCGRKSMNYSSEQKRERNRAAVKKCRQRQALKYDYLLRKAEALEIENRTLSDLLVQNVELDEDKRVSLTRGIQMDILLKIKEIFTQSLPKDFVLDADSIWDLNSVLAVSMPSRCYYGIESIKDFWRTSLRMRNKGKIRSFWAWLFRLPPGDRFSEFNIEPFSPTSNLYFISWETKSNPPLAGSMVIMFGHGHRVTLHVECFGWLIWRYLLMNEPFPEPPMD